MMKIADDFHLQKKEDLPAFDDHPFCLDHPGLKFTLMPARIGNEYGNIRRSNRWPNCSFFTNWTSLDDSIVWYVNVPCERIFKVTLNCTCPFGNEGSTIQLFVGADKLLAKNTDAHNPPLKGMEEGLTPREES